MNRTFSSLSKPALYSAIYSKLLQSKIHSYTPFCSVPPWLSAHAPALRSGRNSNPWTSWLFREAHTAQTSPLQSLPLCQTWDFSHTESWPKIEKYCPTCGFHKERKNTQTQIYSVCYPKIIKLITTMVVITIILAKPSAKNLKPRLKITVCKSNSIYNSSYQSRKVNPLFRYDTKITHAFVTTNYCRLTLAKQHKS